MNQHASNDPHHPDRLAQILADEARAAVGGDEHPADEELAAYLDDDHSPREDEIRDHLVACRRCTERLLEMEMLSTPDALPTADEPVDFARVVAWRALSDERQRRRVTPRRTVAWIAATLLLAAGLGWLMAPFLGGPPTGVPAFEENVAIHYLDELTRSRSFETSVIEVEAEAWSWVLILTPPADAARYPRYAVELYAESSELLYRTDDLQMSDHGTLRLRLSVDAVPAGDLRLVLHGVTDDEAEMPETPEMPETVEIEAYPLRIVYR